MKPIRNIAIVWAVLAGVLSAAGVWEEKPFMQWSEKDVDKILSDSPWAGKASITHEKAGADLGPVPDWKLIVSVRSATPIRQAFARRQLLAGGTASPDLEANLAKPYPRYAFAISNIPRLYQPQLAKSAQAAIMKLKGKPVSATDASVVMLDKNGNVVDTPPPARGRQGSVGGTQIILAAQRGGGGGGGSRGGGGSFGGGFGSGFGAEDKSGITATLVVEFPRTDGITAADGDVELSTVLGNYGVKHTFKLKDMVIQGTLAF